MKDKVVIITGGSSGIGKALAEEFGKNGSKILITGRNPNDLNEVVENLGKKGIIITGFRPMSAGKKTTEPWQLKRSECMAKLTF